MIFLDSKYTRTHQQHAAPLHNPHFTNPSKNSRHSQVCTHHHEQHINSPIPAASETIPPSPLTRTSCITHPIHPISSPSIPKMKLSYLQQPAARLFSSRLTWDYLHHRHYCEEEWMSAPLPVCWNSFP